MKYASVDVSLKARVETDVILGAVSTWDLATRHTDLYFKRSEMAMLYADPSYSYSNEGEFLRAVEARMKDCKVIARPFTDRLIVRLAPENAQEIMTQVMAVRAVAHGRSEIRTL